LKKKLAFFIGVALILLLSTIAYHRFRVETKRVLFFLFPLFSRVSVDQPIRFNHIHHKEVAKLDCSFCHRYPGEYRIAGIPNIEICRICHSSDAISKKPEALRVVDYVKKDKKIPWKRMYELPPYVVFPHWVHIQSRVDCSTCHGLTGVKERPLKMVDRNHMEWCIDCHEKGGVDTDCYTCHSS